MKKNGATILTCVGAIGVVATTITAVNATPKAIRLLDEAKNVKNDKLTKLEIVKIAGPVYIPTLIIGAATISCIFGSNILNKRKQASMIGAYTMLDQTFKKYRDKVISLYSEDANEKVQEEIANDDYKDNDILLNGNNQLFYDEHSGRFFEADILKVQEAEYQINRNLVMRDYAYLNEWYEELDIDIVDSGYALGWSTGSNLAMYWQPWLDFSHKHKTTENGRDYISIGFWQEPILDFEDYC